MKPRKRATCAFVEVAGGGAATAGGGDGDWVMTHEFYRRAISIAIGLIRLGAVSTHAPAEDGAIRLGLVAPMSGPNSRYSSFSLRGAQLAAREINDAGGVGGRKITIISGDSQGTPVEGVSATRRLIDLDKADFIIGDVSSSVTLAA